MTLETNSSIGDTSETISIRPALLQDLISETEEEIEGDIVEGGEIDGDTQSTSSFFFTSGPFSRTSTFQRYFTTSRQNGDGDVTSFDMETGDSIPVKTEGESEGDSCSPPTGSSLVGHPTTAIIEERIETIVTMEGVDPDSSLHKFPDAFPTNSMTPSITSQESRANFRQNLLFQDSTDETFVSEFDLNFGEESYCVPFPELAVDLVDINHPSFSLGERNNDINNSSNGNDVGVSKYTGIKNGKSPSFRLMDVESWEDNWLFKKKKTKSCSINNYYFAFADLDSACEPVRMFIPNPCEATQTLIGDEDAQNLEELSERNSVASLVFSSSDDEESDLPYSTATTTSPSDRIVSTTARKDSNIFTSVSTSTVVSFSPSSSKTIVSSTMTQGLGDKSDSISSNSTTAVVVVDAKRTEKSNDTSSSNSNSTLSDSGNNIRVINKNNMPLTDSEKMPSTSTAFSLTSSCIMPVFVMQTSSSGVKQTTGSVQSMCFKDSDTNKVSLPTFVPLSKRMESSRSDPSFVIKPYGPNKPVQTDILIQIVCRVRGSRPLGVAWFKGDTLLSGNDDVFRIFSNGNEHVLEIKATREEHSDHYSCVVYNGYGEQWADFTLKVCAFHGRVRSPINCNPVSNKTTVSYEPPVAKTYDSSLSPPLTPSSRGINVDSFTCGSARVITRTWAERNPETVEKQDKAIRVGSLPSTSDKVGKKKRESDVFRPKSDTGSSSHDPTHREEEQSGRPVIYSSFSSSEKRESPDSLPTCVAAKQKNTTTIIVGDKQDDISRLSLKCQDLSVYRRDYFVPSKPKVTSYDELPNAVEEKVCNYGKRFSPDNNRRGSGTESTSILSKSSREEGLGSEEDERDGDRGSDGLPRTPSVKGLVRRFSRRDRSPIRSPTFRSSNSIYDEYNGRGVTPRSTSTGIEVHSLTGRSLGCFYKLRCQPVNLDRPTSVSLFNIDRVPESLSPRSSENGNGSPSTEGYISDDSAMIATTKKPVSSASPVQMKPSNRVCRKLTKRASFWQQRCEKGLLSDTQVHQDFPELDVVLD